jgi:hypothetical protein
VKRCTERDKTRLEHTWEIAKAFGLKDFASADTSWRQGAGARLEHRRRQHRDGRHEEL